MRGLPLSCTFLQTSTVYEPVPEMRCIITERAQATTRRSLNHNPGTKPPSAVSTSLVVSSLVAFVRVATMFLPLDMVKKTLWWKTIIDTIFDLFSKVVAQEIKDKLATVSIKKQSIINDKSLTVFQLTQFVPCSPKYDEFDNKE